MFFATPTAQNAQAGGVRELKVRCLKTIASIDGNGAADQS
jgi:hypothetical protein